IVHGVPFGAKGRGENKAGLPARGLLPDQHQADGVAAAEADGEHLLEYRERPGKRLALRLPTGPAEAVEERHDRQLADQVDRVLFRMEEPVAGPVAVLDAVEHDPDRVEPVGVAETGSERGELHEPFFVSSLPRFRAAESPHDGVGGGVQFDARVDDTLDGRLRGQIAGRFKIVHGRISKKMSGIKTGPHAHTVGKASSLPIYPTNDRARIPGDSHTGAGAVAVSAGVVTLSLPSYLRASSTSLFFSVLIFGIPSIAPKAYFSRPFVQPSQ